MSHKPANSDRPLRTSVVEAHLAAMTPSQEEALAVFGHWLDGELAKLVARHEHLAAPAAKQGRSTRRGV